MNFEIKRPGEDKTPVVAEISKDDGRTHLVFLAQIESGGYKWLAFDDGPAPSTYILNRHSDVCFNKASNAIQHLRGEGYHVDILPRGTKLKLEITI